VSGSCTSGGVGVGEGVAVGEADGEAVTVAEGVPEGNLTTVQEYLFGFWTSLKQGLKPLLNWFKSQRSF